MKRALLVMGVAFAVTLAIIFGTRASTDALGIVVGVILGVIASVPTTLLVAFILFRSRPGLDRNGTAMPQQPPVVVISGQSPQPVYPPPPSTPVLPSPTPKRTFTIIGDDNAEAE